MRKLVLFLIALFATSGLEADAAKGRRVALVIGNGGYLNAGPLVNPVNDARDMAAKLATLGFTVIEGYDLGKRSLEGRIGDFADALDGADAGLFYYAGHGLQVDGRNFIVPVDARLDQPAKLRLEAVPMDDIIDIMESQAPVSLVFLDACRNNPFARSLSQTAKTRSAAALGEGLAQFASSRGSFIAFSTAPGAVAMDGSGRNSPFTAALLRHIATPDASISDMMIAVRRDVIKETRDFQTPWEQGSLTERFEFAPSGAKPQQIAEQAVDEAARAEIEALIRDRYLKPEPANLGASLGELFGERVVSYGVPMTLADLTSAKVQWFSQWERWHLEPGRIAVTAIPGGQAAKAEFSLTYSYWPKDGGAAVSGKTLVTLGLSRLNSGWRVISEDGRSD